ncbi:unnamed protein product [Linum trigynum]|uniref:Uncharacterized protein n=1 Tax=Linum trigynum TaxID=586398 RepID=A0AAV2G484_9ROSI
MARSSFFSTNFTLATRTILPNSRDIPEIYNIIINVPKADSSVNFFFMRNLSKECKGGCNSAYSPNI